jgi:hypothetical protein
VSDPYRQPGGEFETLERRWMEPEAGVGVASWPVPHMDASWELVQYIVTPVRWLLDGYIRDSTRHFQTWQRRKTDRDE